eukprot:TRINITY_DN4068_c1_g4_i1.p1 TRINITY_DN4068_c1_g4~~TRINITY_DN4068_c1_g4_i1.p1  ORF type:complete len:221 (+),score=25.19 TRINITY_DN4068_c1_g4_i1:65-664(+)
MKRNSIHQEDEEPSPKYQRKEISPSELEKLAQQVQEEFEKESDCEDGQGDEETDEARQGNSSLEFYEQAQFSEEETEDFSGDGELSKKELNARRLAVFESLSGSQLDRYECYRRASFQKSKMTRVMRYILRQNVNERMIISMQGIAKLFVGELVECARKVANDRGDSGPLKPAHFHAAYQTLYREGKIPVLNEKRRPFM